MAETKLTKRARDIVLRMHGAGEKLCAEVSETEEAIMRGKGFRYWLEPSGKRCGPSTACELIEKRAVLPCRDGLLEGFDQSWKVL